jgi:hypothetical protein
MAMITGHKPITEFTQWYTSYEIDERNGALEYRNIAPVGQALHGLWRRYKTEADKRLQGYDVLEKLADAEVIHPKADLPNVSSGETAGLVRRTARSLVQNTPNVEVISIFDDDTPKGIFSKYVLTSKIIGSDQYSNDMQQSLFASTKTALTLGFACVIPALVQDAAGSWYMKYDSIHYRDVFPEPGAKDIREATNIFVRRYLTEGEVRQLCYDEVPGWDHAALRRLKMEKPRSKDMQSVDKQSSKHHTIPEGYEIITWYSSTGENFLTFDANTMMLLRIEKNKHPLKHHPVFFLVMEKDDNQPYGKSQVELLIGRQDFQDLMLNGAMKLWYRNINPSIIGYGTVNSIPNLSPGKYTQIPNPNAKIEPFEVNTQSLMQFGAITEQNQGNMISLFGASDQLMATQAGNGGMSATPQGVEAQNQLVDTTTNNYQKAVEGFFSHYCSYALTMYFHELAAIKSVMPTAEARIKLLKAGLQPYTVMVDEEGNEIVTGDFDKDGTLNFDFKELAQEYYVRCIPGSLVELEDEKQLRVLNQLFVPLSQALPAMAATQNQEILGNAALAMQYIIQKQLELSGAADAVAISELWKSGNVEGAKAADAKILELKEGMNQVTEQYEQELEANNQVIGQMQEQISLLVQGQQALLEKLGVSNAQPVLTSVEDEVPA